MEFLERYIGEVEVNKYVDINELNKQYREELNKSAY